MRDEVLKGHTRRIKTGCGNLYITINEDQGQPKEVFVRLGKAGGCAASQSEAIGRLVTLALRAGVEIEEIVKQMAGIGCHQPQGFGENKVLSCADAVARCLGRGLKKREEPPEEGKTRDILETYEVVKSVPKPKREPTPKAAVIPLSAEEPPPLKHEDNIAWAVEAAKKTPTFAMTPCPDCGSSLIMEEGCVKCYVCGFTKC